MAGNNKNIRARKAIKKALPSMKQPFMTKDIAVVCGYDVRRVAGLLPSMDLVRKETTPTGEYRCVWFYDGDVV